MLAWLAAHNIGMMDIALVGGVLAVIWALWKVQTSPKIDLVDLLIDTDGKASWTKITAIGAFLFATWAMVYLVVHQMLTLGYFLSYLAVYSGAPIAYKMISAWLAGKGIPQLARDQTVTVETPGQVVTSKTTSTPPPA